MPEYDSDEIDQQQLDSKAKKRWRASEPPPDPWGDVDGADAEGKWRYKIIGEEVDYEGDIRLETRWDDWHRADGTKTTWENSDRSGNGIDSIHWTRQERRRRRSLAMETLSIELPTTTDIHNDATHLRSQAYDEKLSRVKKEPQPNQVVEMAKLLAKHQAHIHPQGLGMGQGQGASSSDNPLRSSQRTSARQHTLNSIASSSTPAARGSSKASVAQTNAPEVVHSSSSTLSGLTASSSSTPMTKIKVTPSVTPVHRTTPAKETSEAQRKKLGNEWTLAARARGGARVSFFNDVDNEAIPSITGSFRYLECSYLFARGIDRPDSGFLTSCNCDICGPQPATCSCQDDWEQNDFAYTSSGLYAFNVPRNIEVIECNKLCSCSIECMNRVSQRPRDVPIQIFKTHNRGWGVRAMVPLKRGKVIGIYTGRLIRREASRALSADLASYCFDLDGDEMVNNDQSQSTQGMQGKYSVDSRREGNWTRFINHSCSPNLEIYLVVHDRPAGSGMPYIAFVASQNIPAFTELAFDYHPEVAAQLALAQLKAKGKKVKLAIPDGSRQCLCEAAGCRGYMA